MRLRPSEQEAQLPPYMYNVAADVAILAGDLETAREYILIKSPILTRDADLKIDRFTIRDIVKLAFIVIKSGDVGGGTEMLEAALPVVQTLPRLGMFGQGIRDVQIYAILGRKDDALAALRAAVDAGYRSSIVYDNWILEFDPFLDNIREDDRFTAIIGELELLNAAMRARVTEAEETGNWAPLRALAGST